MKLAFDRSDSANLNDQQSQNQQCQLLRTFFESQIESIDRQLVRDLSFISQLAHYKDGMQVIQVEALPAGDFYLHFEYQWHIFNGCMGLNETGKLQDKVKFSLTDERQIILDLTPFQTLSTADEL